jgi:hypothetical protein
MPELALPIASARGPTGDRAGGGQPRPSARHPRDDRRRGRGQERQVAREGDPTDAGPGPVDRDCLQDGCCLGGVGRDFVPSRKGGQAPANRNSGPMGVIAARTRLTRSRGVAAACRSGCRHRGCPSYPFVAARKSSQKPPVVSRPAVSGSPTGVSWSSNGSEVPMVSTRKVSNERPARVLSSSPSGP